jgi:NAD(P)-dependent dehydrogenase (short-subunit alcohol dehydrogenase family)
MEEQKVAIVSGANRGIGKEIVRQLANLGFKVLATGRKQNALEEIENETDNNVVTKAVDISVDESCKSFSDYLKENFTKVDVLVNNAGIMGNNNLTEFDLVEIEKVMNTNLLGAIRLTKACFPLLKNSSDARIINVSSEMGKLSGLNGSHAAYRLSKWSLNGFTIMLAKELVGTGIKVNAMCPGWCHTDMGGAGAPRTPAQGAETVSWLATSDTIGTGKFYSNKKEISW